MKQLSRQEKDARDRKYKKLLDDIIAFAKEEDLPLSEVSFGISAALFKFRENFVKSLDYHSLSNEALGANIAQFKSQKKKKTLTPDGEAILNALEIEQKKRLEAKKEE